MLQSAIVIWSIPRGISLLPSRGPYAWNPSNIDQLFRVQHWSHLQLIGSYMIICACPIMGIPSGLAALQISYGRSQNLPTQPAVSRGKHCACWFQTAALVIIMGQVAAIVLQWTLVQLQFLRFNKYTFVCSFFLLHFSNRSKIERVESSFYLRTLVSFHHCRFGGTFSHVSFWRG